MGQVASIPVELQTEHVDRRSSGGSALQPRPHLFRDKERTSRQTVTYTMAASFTELVTAVGSYTTIDVTASIFFEDTIRFSGVYDLVIRSSTGSLFDGQNQFQMFLVSGSTIEFHNITFTNGYTEEVCEFRHSWRRCFFASVDVTVLLVAKLYLCIYVLLVLFFSCVVRRRVVSILKYIDHRQLDLCE